LYSAILLKLCKKFRPSAPPQEKLVLVLDALSKIEIRILALDEVNFTEVGTAAKQKRFLNALRYLANELRISIVCLGTEEMMRVIRSVSSVENRFPPTILPRWRTDDEFRQLLASMTLLSILLPTRCYFGKIVGRGVECQAMATKHRALQSVHDSADGSFGPQRAARVCCLLCAGFANAWAAQVY
jgi:hypothetical protein